MGLWLLQAWLIIYNFGFFCLALLTMHSMALDRSANFTFQNGRNNENMA